MIRVELVKLLRRPRTWVTILMLNALPTLVAVLLAVTDIGPQPGEGPAFLSAVLTDGTLFPLAALAIVLPLCMPVAVAVVAGDAVAGEATGGTLRYVLTRPVRRTTLLVAKLVSVLAFVLLAVVVVAAVGYVVGRLLLGGGDASGLVTGVSGSSLTSTQLVERTLMSVVYVSLSMLGVAAMALMLSTFTDSAIGAALGALAFLIASTLLLTLDAAQALRPYLPTRYWLAFVLLAVVVVAAVGYVVGRLLLGGGDASTLVTGISGSSLTSAQLVERTLMSVVYVSLSMLSVAAIALLLSTLTDSPLGAALGALAFLIASTLLLTLDAASSLQPYLPTRYWLSFVDLFRDPILWRDIVRGVLLQGVYVAVFLGAAWANFTTKDITS